MPKKQKRLSDEEFLMQDFDFSKARRSTPEEMASYRRAYINTFGKEPPVIGRPAKHPEAKYKPVSIRLDPRVLSWAKREAKKRGIGYQTLINEALLKLAS